MESRWTMWKWWIPGWWGGVQTSFYRWELEVAKTVHLSLSHSWSGCLAPSVMAVLSLRVLDPSLSPALWSVISSVTQLCPLFATPWTTARQASLSITNSRSSLRLTSMESVMPSSHLILCCPLLLLPQSLPASESFPVSQLFAWGGQILLCFSSKCSWNPDSLCLWQLLYLLI